MGRWLGIDPGTKRLGLAAGSTSDGIASPLKTVPARPRGAALDAVRRAAEDYGAVGIVVGWPLNMDDTEGPQARDAAGNQPRHRISGRHERPAHAAANQHDRVEDLPRPIQVEDPPARNHLHATENDGEAENGTADRLAPRRPLWVAGHLLGSSGFARVVALPCGYRGSSLVRLTVSVHLAS